MSIWSIGHKNLHLSCNIDIHLIIAVLEFNWPGSWKIELANSLGIQFEPAIRSKLITKLEKDSLVRMKKRMNKYIIKETMRRVAKRECVHTKDGKSNDYIPKDDKHKDK